MKRIILFLIVLSAGWMLLDGIRALTFGDFVTPTTGEHAGQLGPWANLVAAVGIEPRSMFMKLIFVLYGIVALTAVAGYALNQPWGRMALIVMAMLGLWYVPVGTAANLTVLVLLGFRRE